MSHHLVASGGRHPDSEGDSPLNEWRGGLMTTCLFLSRIGGAVDHSVAVVRNGAARHLWRLSSRQAARNEPGRLRS